MTVSASNEVAARSRDIAPGTRFYVPPPAPEAVKQGIDLLRSRDLKGAVALGAMIAQGHAVWFEGGTPADVSEQVAATMHAAAAQHRMPVLVAYNVPGRDCSQYSAGGAADTAAYAAWIDGFARGIGDGKAIVILEPDGLGIVQGLDWCPGTPETVADRYAQLSAAVDRIGRQPQASVYLDGTHSAWLGVCEIAQRLVSAGVLRARGFFLNASNYQPTERLVKYGTWISKCIAFANNPDDGGWRLGHYDWCGSQYSPADANDFSTWTLTDDWYDANLGTATPTARFVIDTSRNGRGPLDASPYGEAPYDQPPDVVAALQAGAWCNPPGRGAGLRPTADTGVPLLDAYLWIKVPGESDGSCDIAGGTRAWDFGAFTRPDWPTTADAQARFDPLWGMVDPAAGEWFPAQALELAKLASPPLF